MSDPVRLANSAGDPYFGRYRDGWIRSSNLRLHYTEWNPAGEKVIVLLHGLNVQLHTWDPIADQLAADYRVICLDLRGHGDSEWASEGYRVETFVADLVELNQQLDLGTFDLVGHSLGARIAVAYAGDYLSTVRHLILSDTGPEVAKSGALAAVSTVGGAGDVKGFRNEEEALAYFVKAHPSWLPEFRELHVRHQLRLNWAGKLVFKADPDLFWILGSVAKRETPLLWEAASRITIPSLLCVGETSPFFDDELVERTKAGFPDLSVQYFPTGHYIPRERPTDFVDAVREFIAK